MTRKKNLIAIVVGWLTLGIGSPSVVHAADNPTSPAPSTGAIGGRVQNIVTGQYLNNARVSVAGTDLIAFTDETGTYRLTPVPVGEVIIEVFYTGLDPQRIPVQVSAGQTTERDINLTSVLRYGQDADVMRLDSFLVSSSRETDGEAIAINEQRFAPNIKNVMAADSLGDVLDGNIGEFLKFLPGIVAEYDSEAGGTVAAISVRGFGSNMTTVSNDGAQMANTSNAMGSSRTFQFAQVSINNVSRIEVTKVPTPATPADSLAGSVNLVSKSAFERKTAQLRYSLSLSANHKSFHLKKVPHTDDRKVFTTLPSVSFDYTLPVSKDFGIVVTGLSTNRYGQQYSSRREYNAGGTATGASFAAPYMRAYRVANSPRFTSRNSLAVRADWRVTRNSVLSMAVQGSHYESHRMANAIVLNAGTNANPTPASGTRLTYGEDFTVGATGRGAVNMRGTASVNHILATTAANARHRFDNGDWRIETALNYSLSKGGYRDTDYGHFRQFGTTTMTPVRVTFADIGPVRPGVIQVFDNNNQEVDLRNLDNFRLNTAQSSPREIRDIMTGGSIDVRKRLNLLPFPTAVQVGGLHRRHVRDIRRQVINWTYNGPDGNPNTPDPVSPFQNTVYVNQDDHYGFRDYNWPSLRAAYSAFKENPNLFTKLPAQIITEETYRINNSEYLRETVSALYLQGEARLWSNRLHVVTGVRYEKTIDKGEGPLYDPNAVYARNADGSFVRDAAGVRVRKPEAGAVGSLEELGLIRRERAFAANRSYDGYYPSLHFTYAIRENLLARAAYAKTYGRPDFTEIIPNATIDEADIDDDVSDPSTIRGNLNVRNTGLRPWSADNYDLSLEYYTNSGGLLSVGVFWKEIDDFFGNFVKIATLEDLEALGLDPRYEGWRLTTRFNSGDARVQGAEFNIQHSLQPLGLWGRYFTVFVNGSKLRLQGHQQAAFASFIPKSMNWGFAFSKKPLTFRAKWNYRGLQRRNGVPGVGSDGFEYDKARTTLDLNLDLQLRKNVFFSANVQNLFNVPQTVLHYGSQTPDYARQYLTTANGIQFTFGIKGTF